MDKPWNGTCPSCKNIKAYQSCFSWLCPNMDCDYYDQAQLDLVLEYELQEDKLKKDALDALGVPEIPNAANDENVPFDERDTLPYYPTGAGGVACTPPSQADDAEYDPDIDDNWTDLMDPPLF